MRLKIRRIKLFVLMALVLVCAAQDSAEPPDHGAYYKTKDGWQKLELLTATGLKVGAFSGGVNSYRGPEAPVQLSDRRPVFYVKVTPAEALIAESGGPNPARNAVIVLLNKKKDHRELQAIKSGLFGAKTGFDKKRMPDVTLQSIKSSTGAAFQSRLVGLGDMTGKTATEIIAVLGSPTSRTSNAKGQVLLQWLAPEYQVAIVFDAEERFVKTLHQSANSYPGQHDLMITVTPNEDLAPGEYLLTWDSMGNSGYDFGIK